MLYSDGNGFPLTIKPSHLYGSTERMDAAEVLSAIVEEACMYVPEVPKTFKSSKTHFRSAEVSKEALTDEDDTVPKEAFSEIKKVPAASVASDFVRIKRNCIELVCLKLLGLTTSLA